MFSLRLLGADDRETVGCEQLVAERLGASSIYISRHNVLNWTQAIFRLFEGIFLL